MSGDIHDIKRMLVERIQAVVEHLLPNGVKHGNEWRIGSIEGEAGQSLGVHLAGLKAGVWSDFATGDSGDLLDLWCRARSVALSDALVEARRFLGIERPEHYRETKRTYERPPKPMCTTPKGRVRDYLVEERNLPTQALDDYLIGEDGDDIVFLFLTPGGELTMAKRRKAEDGAKPVPTGKNCQPILFGWQAIPDHSREIVITEGEIDALSMWVYGFHAMSVPFGGGGGAKQQWIEHDLERLDRFEIINIATDMDKPGDEAAAEIADRLGRHRCRRVNLPRKDANACLVDGVSRDEIAAAVANAKSLDPDGLRRAGEYVDEVVRLFHPQDGDHVGYKPPYGKLDGKFFFRPGETTVWSGAAGAGKSQVLSDNIVDWIDQGSRVCLASLEMRARQSLRRMVKQVLAVDRPTPDAIAHAIGWLDQGLVLYDHVGKSGVRSLLDIFTYARQRFGCDQFVIDSLMRLGVDGDDYAGQEKAMFGIVNFAIEHDVHVHLVAHARKGERGSTVPLIDDVKGAMEIGANAANIIAVWRNRGLEDDIQSATSDDDRRKLTEKPGVILNVAKQRNGDFEGKIGLWFNRDTFRYRSSYDTSLFGRQYLTFDDDTAVSAAAR